MPAFPWRYCNPLLWAQPLPLTHKHISREDLRDALKGSTVFEASLDNVVCSPDALMNMAVPILAATLDRFRMLAASSWHDS